MKWALEARGGEEKEKALDFDDGHLWGVLGGGDLKGSEQSWVG